MKTRAYFLVFILFLGFTFPTNAQKKSSEEKIKGVVAVAVGGATQTPEQVKQKAIDNAKVEALKKAGIEENINSYSDYFRSESDNTMGELFTSDVLSNIRGSVKDIEVLEAKMGFTPEGQIQCTVTLNCTVVKYNTEKDLTFDAYVDGIKMVYKEGDGLEFKIKPTANCYVRAFMFTPNSAFILLPNQIEQPFMMIANTEYSYPYNAKIYELDAGGGKRELNRLVLVLVKKDIPYTGEVDYKAITDWIMTIPPDERVIKSFTFDVFNQK